MTMKPESGSLTVKGLAKLTGVAPASMRKKLRRKHDNPEWLKKVGYPDGFPIGVNDVLPESVVNAVLADRGATEQKEKVEKATNVAPKRKALKTAKNRANELPIGIDLTLAGAVLVMADGAASGWIGKEAYDSFWYMAFFLPVGLAIGYAALKIVIEEKKGMADVWAWGFGIFQFLIHASAFELFAWPGEDLSFYLGKLVLAVAIPLGGAGVAYSARKKLGK